MTFSEHKNLKVKNKLVFCDKEVEIQRISDNKLLNKAGGMYKTGLIVVNCRVVVEVGKKMTEFKKKVKAMAEQKKAHRIKKVEL